MKIILAFLVAVSFLAPVRAQEQECCCCSEESGLKYVALSFDDGPTQSGGAYSTAYYYDADGLPCGKAKAKSVNIIEYSEDGKRVNESYCTFE